MDTNSGADNAEDSGAAQEASPSVPATPQTGKGAGSNEAPPTGQTPEQAPTKTPDQTPEKAVDAAPDQRSRWRRLVSRRSRTAAAGGTSETTETLGTPVTSAASDPIAGSVAEGDSVDVTTDPAAAVAGADAAGTDGKKPGRWWRNGATWRRLALLAVATFVWAALCDFVLEYPLRTGRWFEIPIGPAFVGTVLIWILLLAIYGLIGSLRWTFVLAMGVCITLAAINAERVNILREPLVPGDLVFLNNPGFLVEMVGVSTLVFAVVGGVVGLVLVWFVLRRFGPQRQRPRRGAPGHLSWWAMRGVFVALGVVLVMLASDFTRPGNVLRQAYAGVGATWRPWSQLENYQFNGFVGGALYNLPGKAMDKPDTYDEATMEALAKRWTRRANKVNVGTDPKVLGKTNVVIVLSESMGDTDALDTVSFPEDPMPNVHELMKTTWGGNALAWDYGTGTSAMEFSALTGQSLGLFRPTINSPYQQFVADRDTYPSAVGWLKSSGHKTVAIHPFKTYMYRRPEVYKTFGFDKFLDKDTIGPVSYPGNNNFIADRTAYGAVVNQITKYKRPVFTHLVTMQNHLPFEGKYRFPLVPEGETGSAAADYGMWARGAQISDEAVPGFLEAIKKTGEPTVVIYFGDHFPPALSNDVIDTEGLNVYKTPFFVWSTDGNQQAQAQGYVSPASFLEVATRQIGAPLPPYLELLRQVQQKVGTIRGGEIVSPSGQKLSEADLTPAQQALVDDYRLVQYDFSMGERYAQSSLWYAEPQTGAGTGAVGGLGPDQEPTESPTSPLVPGTPSTTPTAEPPAN